MTPQTRPPTPSNSYPQGEIMRRLQCALFATLAVIGCASIASAADMPVKAPPIWAAPATGPLWEGIYVGVNGGEAWGRTTWCTDNVVVNCSPGGPATDVSHASASGIVGGAQFGDRWQTGNVVYGLEGMLDGMNISKTVADPLFAAQTFTTKFTGVMSATGQFGLAFDRFLAYGKGGWALTELKLQAADPAGTLTGTKYADGWTVGGGLEYQIIPHLIVGVEYDYYRFSPGNITNLTNSAGAAIPCAFCNFGSSTNLQTVLARITLQAGPVPTFR
jgi:outer membrane immunogenic protein